MIKIRTSYRNTLRYFILKHVFNVKVYKEIEIKAQQTATQLLFIDIQQELTKNLRNLVQSKPETKADLKQKPRMSLKMQLKQLSNEKQKADLKVEQPTIKEKSGKKNTAKSKTKH